MNKNFSKTIKSFAEKATIPSEPKEVSKASGIEDQTGEEQKIPYSEYIKNIHETMVKSPRLARSRYKTDPSKYYLVFDDTDELNNGEYDSTSILALFTPFLNNIVWSEPDPLHPNTNIGSVNLFYPEIDVKARVVKYKDSTTFHVPVMDFDKIIDKLDSIEFYKTEEEKEAEASEAEQSEILNSPPPVTPVEGE